MGLSDFHYRGFVIRRDRDVFVAEEGSAEEARPLELSHANPMVLMQAIDELHEATENPGTPSFGVPPRWFAQWLDQDEDCVDLASLGYGDVTPAISPSAVC